MSIRQKYMTAFFAFIAIGNVYYQTHWTNWVRWALLYAALMLIFRKEKAPLRHYQIFVSTCFVVLAALSIYLGEPVTHYAVLVFAYLLIMVKILIPKQPTNH
jgi:hypothetical protein